MRPLIITLAGALASVGTSLAVWFAVTQSPPPQMQFEVVQNGLLRTTADEQTVNVAVAAVLEAIRGPHEDVEQQLLAAEYREQARAWFSQPDVFGKTSERASRLSRGQLDRNGRRVRIEVLRVEEMPALVFVEHEDAEWQDRIVQMLAAELMGSGIRPQ